jgi:hypothetical protein
VLIFSLTQTMRLTSRLTTIIDLVLTGLMPAATWVVAGGGNSACTNGDIMTMSGQCLGCGWEWEQPEAVANYHGCCDDDGGVDTCCPQCGWCSVCDEKSEIRVR